MTGRGDEGGGEECVLVSVCWVEGGGNDGARMHSLWSALLSSLTVLIDGKGVWNGGGGITWPDGVAGQREW